MLGKEPDFNGHDPDWRDIRAKDDSVPLLVDDAIADRSLQNRSSEKKVVGLIAYLCHGLTLTPLVEFDQHPTCQ